MSTKEEQKIVALDFVKHSLQNNLIAPGALQETALVDLFAHYRNNHPSSVQTSVQTSDIIDLLKETSLIKKRPLNRFKSCHNLIEFKDQIFVSPDGVSPHVRDLVIPRIRVARRDDELPSGSCIPNGTSSPVANRSISCDNSVPNDTNIPTIRSLQSQYRRNKNTFTRHLHFLFIEEVNKRIFRLGAEELYPLRIRNVSKTSLSVCFLKAFCIENLDAVNLSYEPLTTINRGDLFEITMSVRFQYYGIHLCPIIVELTTSEDPEKIIRLLIEPVFDVITEHLLDLGPVEPYQPPVRNHNGFVPLGAIRGGFLQSKNLLAMKMYLEEYPIRPSLRQIFNKNFKTELMHESDEIELGRLRRLLCNETLSKILHNREALNVKNYVERFKVLMWLEEYEAEKELAVYNRVDVKVKYEKDRQLVRLKVPGLAEGRPSLMKGDRVSFRQKEATKKFEGVIHNIEEEHVLIGLHRAFTENFLYAVPLDVEFSVNRNDFKVCHRALKQTDQRKMTSFMFPKKPIGQKKEKTKKLQKFFNEKIANNEEQRKAIENIIANSSSPAPYILFGPPGTGKTATLVETITQIWHKYRRQKKICICAPSNSAADLITMRLLEYDVPAREIMRLYAMSRSDSEIPDVLKKCSNYDRLIQEIYFPSKEAIEFKTVVVVTPVTAGRLVSGGITGGHFDYLFMDEAGHAVEPEMLVPIVGLMSTPNSRYKKVYKPSEMKGSLILAGDPKQLGPVIQSKLAVNIGLDMSLLERLMTQCEIYHKDENMKYNPAYITKLVNNYRSHEKILHIPNRLFYENELRIAGEEARISRALNWEGLVERGFPMIFHSVKGQEERESNSPSYFNKHEVQVIEDYLKKLMNRPLGGRIVKQSDIGIISPYKKQVQKIKYQLKKSDWTDITVASVEEFQGQERLIMIISTVRSQPKLCSHDYQFGLGFLNNAKRFNVAVTRAMALLIIVGNPDILLCDPNWRALINYCVDNFAFIGERPSHTVAPDFVPQDKRVKLYTALTVNADNYLEDYGTDK